ncbi:hypothetical protein Pint_24028 [Pistacia integerrima]|uniref:Uncharacterized protein n=1 Tax=Pistacia integerrima TaxID=434235 RepID=A0ACC0YKJ9_9ROSI|nr:hypothetical protein Pint_24028 [Pistacia integerrima]
MKTWSSFYRDRHDSSSCLLESLQPFYDRLVIKDTNGLGEIFLNQWCNRKFNQISVDFGNMVRATLLVTPIDMEKIKQWIISECKKKNRSKPTHLSPSNLTCAFVWVCYMKAQARVDYKIFSREDVSYFGFNAGAITRLDYPVPSSYFGNCIGFARCMARTSELLGEDGIIVAANQIGNKVKELDKSILEGAEKWISDYEVFFGSELHVTIAGSPKLDLYQTDFGWGTPKKIEEISIDKMRGISFSESRFLKGGIEIGLALPEAKMDAFISIFTQHLKFLQ